MTHKLAITLWNYKGGVGKSTISLILAEIAAAKGLRVLAVDLDEQTNLAGTLSLSGQDIKVRTHLDSSFADEDFDLFILDTHPSKDDIIVSALRFADIVLIPVLGDYQSIMNLRSVFDYVTDAGVGAGQVAIIKNCMSSLKTSLEIESILDAQGYASAGRLPRSNVLVRNIAVGDRWDKGMQNQQSEPFLELYAKVWSAFEQICSGHFDSIWG